MINAHTVHVHSPKDALTFAKYLDRPDVITAALESRFGNDLEWTLQQANRRYDEALAAIPASMAACSTADNEHAAPVTPIGARAADRSLDGIAFEVRRDPGCECCTSWVEYLRKHGASVELTVTKPIGKRSPERQAELDRQKADRAAKAHRGAFARDAIMGRIRSKDLAEIVLPVLLAVAGQTELIAAAKVLGVTEPEPSAFGSSHNDWAGPFARWAAESPANLHRAMLAVAYAHGTARYSRSTAADTVTAWPDSLGYEPAPE